MQLRHEIHEVGQSPAYLKPTKYHQTDMKFQENKSLLIPFY